MCIRLGAESNPRISLVIIECEGLAHTESRLRGKLKTFQVLVGALERVTHHNQLIRVVRMCVDVQLSAADNLIGFFVRGTITAHQLHTPEVGTEFVLHL